MSRLTQEACDKLAEAITRDLYKNKADRADPSMFKTLAEAISLVHFGPQGGDKFERTEKEETSTEIYDQHYTTHEGEKRDRPATGFGECE